MKGRFKKGLILLTILSLGFILTGRRASGQVDQEYLVKRDLYQTAHQEYLSARQSYLNYQTLQAKEILFQKLREFLFARSDFLEAYLSLLLSRAQNYPGQLNLDEIKSWLDWLKENRKEIEASATLESLVSSGDKLTDTYPQIERSIYLFLVRLTIAQENRVLAIIERVKLAVLGKMDQLAVDRGVVFQWLDEVEAKIELIRQEQDQALKDLEETRVKKKGDILSGWRKAKKHLITANNQLEESLNFIDEILSHL